MKYFGIILPALVFCICRNAEATIYAGPFTNSSNGHVYYELNPETWTAAETEAESLGGHLATVRSSAENTWLYDSFESGTQFNCWIGLYDPITNDGSGTTHAADFIWVDGETTTYRNWGTNEPDNNSNREYWTLLQGRPYGALVPKVWNDVQNPESPVYGIAEIVPEPGTLALLGAFGVAILIWWRASISLASKARKAERLTSA